MGIGQQPQFLSRYDNGIIPAQVIYGTSEIDRNNFNPMVHQFLTEEFCRTHLQVLVNAFGGLMWITVERAHIE